jgi:4-amino-4-deoxy-L-arabinose transferase-like glycosyltransferase
MTTAAPTAVLSDLGVEPPAKRAPEQRQTPQSARTQLLVIVALAVALRLIVSFAVYFTGGDLAEPKQDHWWFGFETGRLAGSLVNGQGFSNPIFGPSGPSAWLPPVYVIILAGVFKLFGVYSTASALVILILDSVISSLTCIPVFLTARKLFDARIALFSAVAWALFPYNIYLTAQWLGDVILSTPLLAGLLYFTLELAKPRRLLVWMAYGALWGLAALTSPVLLAALPFLLVWLAWRHIRADYPWAARLSTAIIFCGLVISPWLVRNYRVFHQPVFIKDNFWLEFAVGNTTDQVHWWNGNGHPSKNEAEMTALASEGEVAYMAAKRRQSLDFLQNHFSLFLWLCVRRFVYIWFGFWSFRGDYLAREPMDPVNIVFCSALTLLAFAGFLRARRSGTPMLAPLISAVIAVPATYYITHPFYMNYRHPIDPVLVILATYACAPRLASAWEQFVRHRPWLRFGHA